MATAKKKKAVKVRDLKPSKDAKGGAGRSSMAASRSNAMSSSFSSKSSNAFGVSKVN